AGAVPPLPALAPPLPALPPLPPGPLVPPAPAAVPPVALPPLPDVFPLPLAPAVPVADAPPAPPPPAADPPVPAVAPPPEVVPPRPASDPVPPEPPAPAAPLSPGLSGDVHAPAAVAATQARQRKARTGAAEETRIRDSRSYSRKPASRSKKTRPRGLRLARCYRRAMTKGRVAVAAAVVFAVGALDSGCARKPAQKAEAGQVAAAPAAPSTPPATEDGCKTCNGVWGPQGINP